LVKYRKQLLQGEVGDFVKLKIIEIASRSEFNMEEVWLAQKTILARINLWV
jgi:putative transposase